MPIIEVKRQSVRPAVRKVPTSTCAVTMPMTLEQVSREVRTENEEPEMVESLQDAFEKFRPQMKFKGRAGAEEAEFRADLRFRRRKRTTIIIQPVLGISYIEKIHYFKY